MAKDSSKQLYRSEKNRVIAGVCGGLADYFNFDPVIIRIFLVLITLFGGSGVLLYLILWVVIPTESAVGDKSEVNIKNNVEEIKDTTKSVVGNNSRMWAGIFFVGLGLIFLFNNFGIFHFLDLGRFWPVLLIALGLIILNKDGRKN
ncbi:MAG: PspC domain-containing protein [Candidatus Microgenomates bacterium]|jgi:phage shock protein C